MDSITFVENPSRQYCEEIVKEIVRTEDWSRARGEYDIWKETQDLFWFLVAFDKNTNEPVGSISLTMDKSPDGNPDDDLYYIGSFYTKHSHRGIGLGLVLFQKCMEQTMGKNVNLNSALAMVNFYDKRFGFSCYPDYFNAFAKMNPSAFNLSDAPISGALIKNIQEIDFSGVISYDQLICTRQRTKYLKKWLTGEHATTKVAVNDSGNVVGFLCIRLQIVNRITAGPFYANDEKIAHDLLVACLRDVPHLATYDALWMRFPEPNEPSIRFILDKLTNGEYAITRSVKSMFTKRLIEPNPKLVFSVFEAGHSLV